MAVLTDGGGGAGLEESQDRFPFNLANLPNLGPETWHLFHLPTAVAWRRDTTRRSGLTHSPLSPIMMLMGPGPSLSQKLHPCDF